MERFTFNICNFSELSDSAKSFAISQWRAQSGTEYLRGNIETRMRGILQMFGFINVSFPHINHFAGDWERPTDGMTRLVLAKYESRSLLSIARDAMLHFHDRTPPGTTVNLEQVASNTFYKFDKDFMEHPLAFDRYTIFKDAYEYLHRYLVELYTKTVISDMEVVGVMNISNYRFFVDGTRCMPEFLADMRNN